MNVNFDDLVLAFDFVSFGQPYEHQAFLCKDSGKIYWYSEFGDNQEDLPADIDDPKYIEIPQKKELGLGKNLVLDFASEYLSDDIERIESMFHHKGAYAQFKDYLERKEMLEKWYEYETQAQETAVKSWCRQNEINIQQEASVIS